MRTAIFNRTDPEKTFAHPATVERRGPSRKKFEPCYPLFWEEWFFLFLSGLMVLNHVNRVEHAITSPIPIYAGKQKNCNPTGSDTVTILPSYFTIGSTACIEHSIYLF